MDARPFDLEDRLIDFAARACGVAGRLPRNLVGKHVAIQLVRSSTSPFANYGEARAAESRRDFVHKMRICLKELRETLSWLKFLDRLKLRSAGSVEGEIRECSELIAIFVTSIRTAST